MSLSAAEPEALICAFQLAPCGALGSEALELSPSAESPLWLHFYLLDNRARRHLEGRPGLDEDGRQLLLGDGTRIMTQVFDAGFAAILGDLHHDFDGDPAGFGWVRVYLDERVLITCRKHRVRSLDQVRRALPVDGGSTTPFDLFLELVREIVTGLANVAVDHAESVDIAEDKILAGQAADQASELGRVRRVLAHLRRHTAANRSALAPLGLRLGNFCNEDRRQALREIVDSLDSAIQDMELVAERARLLQEEIASQLNEATNRNLYVLSIVTTALLPITLITGIFGMNVGGLPFERSAGGFWWVMLGMSATVAATLVFLSRRRVP